MTRKHTITYLQNYAAKHGGKCLSGENDHLNGIINWECKEGHQWKKSFTNQNKDNVWCYQCKKIKTHQTKLEELKTYAISRGGKCLSNVYIGSHIKIKLECAKGHQWASEPTGIIRTNRWCPYCSGRVQRTKVDLDFIASKYGGECISEEYSDCHTKYEWKCKEGHIWKSYISLIKEGGWCPICSNRKRGRKTKYNIQVLQQIAKDREGRLLSKEYSNFIVKYKWECKNGHQWNAKLSNIISHNSWCPHCPRYNKLSLQTIIEKAKLHGDICISKEYKNCFTLMDFKCSKGHEYSSTVDRIRNGFWCQVCGKENRKGKKYKVKG